MALRFREEQGVALIVVLMVFMVVTALSLAAFQLSIHDANASAYDRKREQAIQAAESGVNAYLAKLPTTFGNALCTGGSDTLLTNGTGAALVRYSVTVSVYRVGGTTDLCPSSVPTDTESLTAVVTGTGTAGLSGSTVSSRKWVTQLNLKPISALTKAVFGDTQLSVSGNTQVNQFQNSTDADVYSNGNLTLTQPQNKIEGSVFAQGYVQWEGCVSGDIWANGSVTIPNGNGYSVGKDCYTNTTNTGFGNVTSSTDKVDISGSTAIGTCTAATTVAGTCGASVPSAPQGPPPSVSLPQFTYTVTDWCNGGVTNPCNGTSPQKYTIVAFSGSGGAPCTSAQNWITGNGAGTYGQAAVGDYVVRVVNTSGTACGINLSANTSMALQGNLAVIMDGSFQTSNKNTWTTGNNQCTASPYTDSRCTLFVIHPYQSGLACGSPTANNPGPYGIMFSQQTDFSGVNLFAYTQCDITVNNLSNINGQVLGGTTTMANNGSFNFVPALVPGFTPQGYNAAPIYFREIQ